MKYIQLFEEFVNESKTTLKNIKHRIDGKIRVFKTKGMYVSDSWDVDDSEVKNLGKEYTTQRGERIVRIELKDGKKGWIWSNDQAFESAINKYLK